MAYSDAEKRVIALEQAMKAFLSEAKAAGVDIPAIAQKAEIGIIGNKPYRWVEGELVKGSIDALEYLVRDFK